MKIIALLFMAFLVSLNASEHGGETDIIPRTINFLIFAGFIYYLIADKIKTYFAERAEGVVAELDKIEEKIRETKRAKEVAENSVTEAEIKSKEIISDAENEAKLLASKIEEQCKNNLASLEKSKIETMEVEKNKMVRLVVSNTLEDIFDNNDASVENQDLILSLLKKVA
jgi:F-type H+-transporting ATPase subunit b